MYLTGKIFLAMTVVGLSLPATLGPANAEKLYFRVSYNINEERRYPDGSQGYLPHIYSLEIYTDDATNSGFIADVAYSGGQNKAGRGGDGVKISFGRTTCRNTVPYKPGGDVDLSKLRTRNCFTVSGSGGSFNVKHVETTTFTSARTVIVGYHEYTVFKAGDGCSVTVNQAERTISEGAFELTGRRYFGHGPNCRSVAGR